MYSIIEYGGTRLALDQFENRFYIRARKIVGKIRMYVHKNCAPAGAELDMDKRVGGFCVFCDQEGTVYHVKGEPDYYEQIVAGILYRVRDGVAVNTRAAVRARLREQNEKRRGAIGPPPLRPA